MNRWSAWRPCETPCVPGDLGRGRWCSPAGWACGFLADEAAPSRDWNAIGRAEELAAQDLAAAARGRALASPCRLHWRRGCESCATSNG